MLSLFLYCYLQLLLGPALASGLNQTLAQPQLDKILALYKTQAIDSLVVVRITGSKQPEIQLAGQFKPATALPLARLGELFASILLLQQLEQGKLKLSDPVNFHLSDFQLVPAFAEITIQHLLERSTGLAMRQSNLYLSSAKNILPLKDLLTQDLKPAVLPPGQIISSQSMGDILAAYLISELAGQPFEKLVQQRILKPLGIEGIFLSEAKLRADYPRGHDSQGLLFANLVASSHSLHGWQARPEALAQLLNALLGKAPAAFSPYIRRALFQPSLKLEPGLATASLGLLEERLQGQQVFYLDSDWFGYTSRIAVLPKQQRAFYISYNSSAPALKTELSSWFAAGSSAFANTLPLTPAAFALPEQSYLLKNQDQHSLLKVLNLFAPQSLKPARSGQAGLSWKQQPWQPVGDLWQDKLGRRLSYQPQQSLSEGFAEHASYRRASAWESWPLQLAIALVFGCLFLSLLWRAAGFLYHYQPPLKEYHFDQAEQEVGLAAVVLAAQDSAKQSLNQPAELESDSGIAEPAASEPVSHAQPEQPVPDASEPLAAEPEQSLPDQDEALNSWDLPLVAVLATLLALAFESGIYPILMHLDRIGDHLSLAVGDSPSVWLIGWLALPLFVMVGAFVLLALVMTQWKLRAWTKFERLHYLLVCLALPLWGAWLASWNLLGFRF